MSAIVLSLVDSIYIHLSPPRAAIKKQCNGVHRPWTPVSGQHKSPSPGFHIKTDLTQHGYNRSYGCRAARVKLQVTHVFCKWQSEDIWKGKLTIGTLVHKIITLHLKQHLWLHYPFLDDKRVSDRKQQIVLNALVLVEIQATPASAAKLRMPLMISH